MDQIVAESTARSRFDTWLMTLFGGCALLLSAIGVYGLMAYSVQQRTAEIGIRMAVGADANRVRNMVLRQGMVVAISGIAVGVVTALWFARLLSGLLFGVAPRDPIIFTTVTLLLAGVAFLAAWLPAQRATRLDPVTALRQE
jgi:putative ABC transport system permease protein